MKHIEYPIMTHDGLELYGHAWLPEGDTVEIIHFVHGIGEHSTRYDRMAEWFCERGVAVAAFDLRGHGKSQGKRGHSPDYDSLMDDLTRVIAAGREHVPCENKGFLYGHSMGGNIVLNYALRQSPEVEGIIATGPWLILGFQLPGWQKVMASVLRSIWPTFTQQSNLDTGGMSHDAEWAMLTDEDPLNHSDVTLGLYGSLNDAADYALEHASELNLPLLLMHGGDDHITSPEGSKKFAARASTQTTLRIWPGLYHEIHNEPSARFEVYQAVYDWMMAHRS